MGSIYEQTLESINRAYCAFSFRVMVITLLSLTNIVENHYNINLGNHEKMLEFTFQIAISLYQVNVEETS